jgi:hypothetical protein
MKTRHLFLVAALAGVAHGGPAPLATGIPAFLDTDGNGVISEAERQAFIETRKDARGGAAPDWDSDGNGTVDDGERAAAVAALQAKVEEKRAELFGKIAGDDGELTRGEFGSLPPFGKVPPVTVDLLFNLLDTDKDGTVTLEEFLGGIRGSAPAPLPGPPAPPTP